MKKARLKERFAMMPHSVLLSDAYRTLPCYAKIVLLVLVAQYDGKNNGNLALTWSMARKWGIRSHEHLTRGLSLLRERGLIEVTRQGGKRPLGPTLYAVTWHPIHHRERGYDPDVTPTEKGNFRYMKWTANGTAGGPDTANQRDCRRGGSGLPADQKTPLTGLPADQTAEKTPCIGTAGSPPSISTRSVYPPENGDDTDGAPW
jgi:hypothetical protein